MNHPHPLPVEPVCGRRRETSPSGVAVPVGIWAALHAYQAYLGELMPIVVLSAFLSGLVLYAVVKYTKSLENMTIVHSLYNSLVVLTSRF